MKAWHIALSLVRIPRLFLTLLFFPLLLSIIFVYLQLLATGLVIKTTHKSSEDVSRTLERLNQKSLARKLLYGSAEPLPTLQVCRWIAGTDSTGKFTEGPATQNCQPSTLDAALQVEDPALFETAPYERILNGNVERLHVCRHCRPDIVIRIKNGRAQTHVSSIQAYWILQLVQFNVHVQKQYLEAAKESDATTKLVGNVFLYSAGFAKPVSMNSLFNSLALPLNIAMIVVVGLWLALKAHRKVLDYFASNGALLPMVAAIGSHRFYAAIWILTIMRVLAFMGAAFPLAYFGLKSVMQKGSMFQAFRGYGLETPVWMLALVFSLGLATLIASIAELKHRHHILSFVYRYVPLLIAISGAIVWALCFLFKGAAAAFVKNFILAIPIVGLAPMLVAPVFKPSMLVLSIHAVLALLIFFVIMRINSRWFAAHLGEL